MTSCCAKNKVKKLDNQNCSLPAAPSVQVQFRGAPVHAIPPHLDKRKEVGAKPRWHGPASELLPFCIAAAKHKKSHSLGALSNRHSLTIGVAILLLDTPFPLSVPYFCSLHPPFLTHTSLLTLLSLWVSVGNLP